MSYFTSFVLDINFCTSTNLNQSSLKERGYSVCLRDVCSTLQYPTFRERSEIPEVSTEISLQPWRNYKTDGVILFSDILTPLPVSNASKCCCAFSILEMVLL